MKKDKTEKKPCAIFQAKDEGKKIYYYITPDKNHWFISIGYPHKGKIYNSTSGKCGGWKCRKQYKNINDLVKLHKADNILKQ
mgnify:CR=1 FL=1